MFSNRETNETREQKLQFTFDSNDFLLPKYVTEEKEDPSFVKSGEKNRQKNKENSENVDNSNNMPSKLNYCDITYCDKFNAWIIGTEDKIIRLLNSNDGTVISAK